MARPSKGNGNIYYRNDRKRWAAQYYEYDPVTLKKKHKEKTFETEEKAKAFLQALMYQKENPIYIENNGIPLKELMKTILQNKFDTNMISEAQYDRVQRTLKSIFKGAIVDKNIDEITPEEIQSFVNTYKDLSDSSIKKIFEQFNQAFKYAFDRGYITRNPMAQVIRPKSLKQAKLVKAMTLDEENKFINYLRNKTIDECPYKNEYLIQLFMGLRIGECLALSESDIDLMHRKIYIHKTLSRKVDGSISLSNSPKTQAGNRYLPIPDVLYHFIVEQMNHSRTFENNNEKLLFKPPINQYTNAENVNRALAKILEELGIEHMSSHSLRHTYATRAIEAGVAPIVLQKLMGHTDVSITLNTYTSVFDKYKETELEKVNKYYMNQNLLQGNDVPQNKTIDNTININDFNILPSDKNTNEIKEYHEYYTR